MSTPIIETKQLKKYFKTGVGVGRSRPYFVGSI